MKKSKNNKKTNKHTKIMTREEQLRNQYIYEKSLLEQYGYQSITTFEEWLEIKNIQL